MKSGPRTAAGRRSPWRRPRPRPPGRPGAGRAGMQISTSSVALLVLLGEQASRSALRRALLLAWRARGRACAPTPARARAALLARRLLLLLLRQPLLLLLEPGRVVALPGDALRRGRARGSSRRRCRGSSGRGSRRRRCPEYSCRCRSSQATDSASRWLVGSSRSSRSGCCEQQLAQGDAPALAAGEGRHVGVARRAAHGVHGDLELAVEVPGVGGARSRPGPRPARRAASPSRRARALAEPRVDLLEPARAGPPSRRRPPRRCRGRPGSGRGRGSCGR